MNQSFRELEVAVCNGELDCNRVSEVGSSKSNISKHLLACDKHENRALIKCHFAKLN